MDWMQILSAGIAGGLFVKALELWANRRKRRAEVGKLYAESDRLRGQTWQDACSWLANDVDKLHVRVADVECNLAQANNYIKYLLRGIGRLHAQVLAANADPCWSPEPRNEYGEDRDKTGV